MIEVENINTIRPIKEERSKGGRCSKSICVGYYIYTVGD